jgi:hypothetical protein
MDAVREALKPYLWLAAIAFVVGFMSYLAIGSARPAGAHETVDIPAAAIAAPMSDEWNVPKRI